MSGSASLSAWVNTTLTKLGARLFRNAVGMAWVGKVKELVRDGKPAVLILEATHLPFGLIVPSVKPSKGKRKSTSGGSDKIGWTPVEVPAGYSEAQIWAAFFAGRDSFDDAKFPQDALKELLARPGMVPDHPSRTFAVFTAVEEKSLAYPTLTPDQRNFLDQVHASGGLAYVARETADGPVLNPWPEPMKAGTMARKKRVDKL